MSKFADLKKRFQSAKSEKDASLERLKEAYRYALPSANVDNYDSNKLPDDSQPEVYDDTAVIALQKYANKTQSMLVPSWKTWAMLKAGSDVPEEDEEQVEELLEEVTEVIFDHINHSNFTSQAHEAFMDLGISTGALICEEGDGITSALRFRAIPMMELVPERSSYGSIKTVWREFKLEASKLQELYPKAAISVTIAELLRDKPQTMIDLIEGVVYNEKTQMYNHVILYEKDTSLLLDEEIESSPYIVFREQVSPSKSLGFGRILQLLPTIIKLNSLSYYEDAAVVTSATGSFTVRDDGTINPENVRVSDPFSLVIVGSNDNTNPTIRPLETSARFDVTDMKIKELQNTINEVMTAQSFGNVEETPVRTAYEMSVRENSLKQTSHSAFGRLQSEFLETLLARVVYVLAEAGKIQPIRVNGRDITIKFTSPSARVEDAEELQALQTFLMYMENMPPEIVSSKFKIEEVPHFVAERTGLPASMLRNKAEEAKAVDGMKGATAEGMQTAADASVPSQEMMQ